ncbi:MAG: hypothetical protein ACI9UR_002189 [Bacteroidia bacterium]|jgi:hypothetical protein
MRLMFIWFLLSSFSVLGQDRVVYNEDFQFENGIYLTFQDFKNNNPIRPEYILSDLDIRNPNYLDRIVENDTITYYDNLYEERSVLADEVWGTQRMDWFTLTMM